MSEAPPPPPDAPRWEQGWYPDPGKRHDYRWYSGERWTDHVSDRGVAALDPITSIPMAQTRDIRTSRNRKRDAGLFAGIGAIVLVLGWSSLGDPDPAYAAAAACMVLGGLGLCCVGLMFWYKSAR